MMVVENAGEAMLMLFHRTEVVYDDERLRNQRGEIVPAAAAHTKS